MTFRRRPPRRKPLSLPRRARPRNYHHRQSMPYPELVGREDDTERGPYQIFDTNQIDGLPTNGLTNIEDRVMGVPLDPSGRPVSHHENAHEKWSPPRPPKVRFDLGAYHAVEDARINLGLRACGLPMRVPLRDRAVVLKLALDDIERGDIAMVVYRLLASLGTNIEETIADALYELPVGMRAIAEEIRSEARERLTRSANRRGGPVAHHRTALKVARDVARRLEALGLLEKRKGCSESTGTCIVCAPSKDRVGVDPGEEGELLAAYPGEDGDFEARILEGGVAPGDMSLRTPKLPVRILDRTRNLQRRYRPSTEGSVVSGLHRYPIDKAIFRRPVRRRGGTILIDVSGSMRLKASDIDTLVRHCGGAAVVAIYSGDGEEGELRIVARDGRRAAIDDLHPPGSGNIVDLPALEWLADQPGPRFWISDGSVSGVGDRSSTALREACAAVRKRGEIERIPDVDRACQRFARRGRR